LVFAALPEAATAQYAITVPYTITAQYTIAVPGEAPTSISPALVSRLPF
jgi:hypothetical protein